MKKFVAFLIAVAYAVSIVVITFFGQQIDVGQFHILMTELEITGEKVGGKIVPFANGWENDPNHYYEDSYDNVTQQVKRKKYIGKQFNKNTDVGDDSNSVWLDFKCGPENATGFGMIKWTIEGGTTEKQTDDGETITTVYATISQQGEVNFRIAKAVTVYLFAEDGSHLMDSVTIICYDPSEE